MLSELVFVLLAYTAPEPFRAVGLYCEAPVAARASSDGIHWTAWQEGHAHEGEGALVWFDTPQRHLEVSRPCRVLFIDPGASPGSKPAARASDEDLAVVTREAWGCTPQTCPAAAPPAFTNVTHLVVHHSAGANQASDWAAVVRSIWVLHVRGNGWNDIGYNYLIDPQGVLYEGRAGGDGVLGAHFSGVNTGTMGVCLLGTYSTAAASPQALATLQSLLAAKARRWRIDPGGRGLHAASGLLLNNISGHRDAGLSPRASGGTECPGNGVHAALPAMRTRVRAAVEGECPLVIERPYRCAAADGEPVAFRLSAPPGCPVEISRVTDWMESAVDDSFLRVRLQPNGGQRRTGSLQVNGQVVTVTQAGAGEAALPCPELVVHAANFDPRPMAPGSLITILGSGLNEATRVEVNGRAATVLYTSPEQINAQLPAATPIGSARVTVSGGPERLFWVTEAVPSIFGAVRDARRMQVWFTGVRPGAVVTANVGDVEAVQAVAPGVWLADVVLVDDAAPPSLVLTAAGVSSLPFVME